MISLILPYWNRQTAADLSLAMMARHYAGMDLEVIVADDGSTPAYQPPAGMPFPVRVVRLPAKAQPLNPCRPINAGAAIARGEYIAISNPEILHETPVLPAMLDEAQRGGEKTYVLAACYDPERRRWHCHSTLKRSDNGDVGSYLPAGADYHFMALMHRSLWDATGGFDEDYRDGAGYDDPDFVRRLHRAGARFVIRDDLVVLHPRHGARASWKPSMFERNRRIFLEKWQPCLS